MSEPGWPLLTDGSTVVVVGASLAGLSSVRALREQGFGGRVLVVGAEEHRPYDRPPLSKDFLAGRTPEAGLALESAHAPDPGAEWLLGRRAVALDPATRTLGLDDGRQLAADAVVLATGARARRLPGTADVGGVHVLRTLDDARALRAALSPGVRLAVVGAGFIGCEVASTASELGVSVTLVEAAPTPLEPLLGDELARVVAGWHPAHGVRLVTGVGVASLRTTRRRGHRHVHGLVLTDGRQVDADVVVVGVGAVAEVDWLAGSGLALDRGVRTDARGATSVPGVVAVGDCATVADPGTGRGVRHEHWTSALERPATAVATLLSAGSSRPAPGRAPYVWSDQYGARLQFAGSRAGAGTVEVVDGDVASGRFVAVYRDPAHSADRPVAVLGVSSPRVFTQWRRRLQPVAG